VLVYALDIFDDDMAAEARAALWHLGASHAS
jgi:hypothetical protein